VIAAIPKFHLRQSQQQLFYSLCFSPLTNFKIKLLHG
jgi:hypothetical protein